MANNAMLNAGADVGIVKFDISKLEIWNASIREAANRACLLVPPVAVVVSTTRHNLAN